MPDRETTNKDHEEDDNIDLGRPDNLKAGEAHGKGAGGKITGSQRVGNAGSPEAGGSGGQGGGSQGGGGQGNLQG